MTNSETPPTPAAASEAPNAPDIDALIEAKVEARIAGLTKKYNSEHAGHRKQIEELRQARGASTAADEGQAPKPAASAERPQDLIRLMRDLGRVEAALPEHVRSAVDAELGEDASPAEMLRAYKLAASIAKSAPPADASANREKPGRDARVNGSQRGASPAARTPDAAPATQAEWMRIVKSNKPEDVTRRQALQRAIITGDFDPDVLPRR